MALLVWKLDWPFYVGMACLAVFWLYAVGACTAAAVALVFCLLVAVASVAVVGYGFKALSSSPRDLWKTTSL